MMLISTSRQEKSLAFFSSIMEAVFRGGSVFLYHYYTGFTNQYIDEMCIGQYNTTPGIFHKILVRRDNTLYLQARAHQVTI